MRWKEECQQDRSATQVEIWLGKEHDERQAIEPTWQDVRRFSSVTGFRLAVKSGSRAKRIGLRNAETYAHGENGEKDLSKQGVTSGPSNGLTDSAVQAAVKKQYFPDQFTVISRDGDKVNAGGMELIWRAVDTRNYNLNLFHVARALAKKTSDVLF
jgi:hypothetical protein